MSGAGDGVIQRRERPTQPPTRQQAVAVRPQVDLAESVGLRVRNVVATCSVGTELDLQTVHKKMRNAEYSPKRFPAAILRIRNPRSTALAYSSGKMVVLGNTSEAMARTSARLFTAIIKKTGHAVRFRDFKVQNMVGTCDIGFPIRLEKLVYAHAKHTSYEPELFPGLIYRMQSPKVVILVFVSGKFVVTGAKTLEEMKECVRKIHPVLAECKV